MASNNNPRSKSHRKITPGPVNSTIGVPYDYIVVVDSGSHGSRAYVYNWLNPQYALEAGIDLSVARKVNLVRRILEDEHRRGGSADGDSDSDSEADSDDDTGSVGVEFPAIHSHKKWHRAIRPGLSSFNETPQKVGKSHLDALLNLASSVVPKSQHHRTPIFIHATAGMRLLPPNEQEPILANVCSYLQSNSEFFMPDCKSHVNIIDGNIEGLYGWLSINYLVGSFDRPDEHQHGKNHTTYGLLDMGGASTQVVFQPNQTETEEHKNNMYRVSLYKLPELQNSMDGSHNTRSEEDTHLPYDAPTPTESYVYSDSFLGFGMFQAHNRYLKYLLEDFRKANKLPENMYRFRTPISDPCLPKGYTFTGLIDDHRVDFTGNSDFQQCLKSIFPVLSNTTHTSPEAKYNGDCQQLGDENQVSSCLLNEKIPSFDFDVNHFIGVSGYWDIVNSLLASQSIPSHDPQNEKYDYKVIYQKTQQLCSSPLSDLLSMNNLKNKKTKIQEEDLAELCFKASWILNFLHVGLGFPRFGIDEVPNKNDKFKSLELVDKLGGSSFSWTLGRAILYANDEYIQAYNNHTKRLDPSSDELPRSGYVYTAAEGSFIYGAEPENVASRPLFTVAADDAEYPHYDYEENYQDPNESQWSMQPHRAFGSVIFVLLVSFALFILFGKRGRALVREKVVDKIRNIGRKVGALTRGRTAQYGPLGDNEPIEMNQMQAGKDDDMDRFRIDDE